MTTENMQPRLEHAEQALAARDGQLVEILLQIAAAQPDPNSPPPPGRYTFATFRQEMASRKIYKQPAEAQRQFRTEKIAMLEAGQGDEALSECLRSFKIILQLWESKGAFERSCLLRLLRELPLFYGPWKAIKKIFKEAEAVDDHEVLAILSHRFDTARKWNAQVSTRTLEYLRRRCWRYLRKLALDLPSCYPDVASDFLAEYKDSESFGWTGQHIFFHEDRKYTRTRFRAWYHRKQEEELLKHRAYAELWKRSPLPLFSLLERAQSNRVQGYAVAALKKDFRNAVRDVEPDWVKRLLSSEHEAVQNFAVWILQNVPRFEQSKFRELGLHDFVLKLFDSAHTEPLKFVAAYARTHARDLPVEELVRLANHAKSGTLGRSDEGSKAVRTLAHDLLKALDPREDVGLENWGRMLETQHCSDFATKALRDHFGAKDLTPEWFAHRMLAKNDYAAQFAKGRLLDVHPVKKLGAKFFFNLVKESSEETQRHVIKFAMQQLDKFGIDALESEQLEALLLHPVAQSDLLQWVSAGKLSPSRFDPEFLKQISFRPTWDVCSQIVEARKTKWGRELDFNMWLAEKVFTWLGDIRLFTPEQVGFEWLMELVARSEPEYHDFAVRTMIKAFLPADFADSGEAEPTVQDSDSDEINVDFESATFLFTGKLATMTRAEAKKKVEAANGKNVGTVNKNLAYLVIGDEGSPMYGQGRKGSKQVKAESLAEEGVPIRIISETAFLQMLTGTVREFSDDAVEEGCQRLWSMLVDSPKENAPLARFALRYLREHHPEICLESTDRPVDPGSEIPDSFLTFERIKNLLTDSRVSLRNFGLELSRWEFARWSPPLGELVELCESPYQEVRQLVSDAVFAEDTPQNRRLRLDPDLFTTDAVYELCQSRDNQVRSMGMKLINLHPRLREPEQLFKLTESPDRSVRAFVVRAFWSLYRERGTTDEWKPTVPTESELKKTKVDPVERYGLGSPERPGDLPAGHDALQFLLRRMLFEISPGRPPRTSGPSLDNLKLKPISTRRGKILLVETLRDLAIEDVEFAKIVLPVLTEFMSSHGKSEHDVCLVAVARIEAAWPTLQSVVWRDVEPESVEPVPVEQGASS
jgi:hypothetical protein